VQAYFSFQNLVFYLQEGSRCQFLPVDQHLLMGASCRVGFDNKAVKRLAQYSLYRIFSAKTAYQDDSNSLPRGLDEPHRHGFPSPPLSISKLFTTQLFRSFRDDSTWLYRLHRMEAAASGDYGLVRVKISVAHFEHGEVGKNI
jgi:hypothetical protein